MRRSAADEPFFLIRSAVAHVPQARRIDRHTHAWAQLTYCFAGAMTVRTRQGSWIAPAHWAIWVPAHAAHEIELHGHCRLCTFYFREDLTRRLSAQCVVVLVSPLMRELLLRTAEIGMLDERDETHRAITHLIESEVARRDVAPFELPMPSSQRSAKAARLLGNGTRTSVAAVARKVGLSPRALERRFLAETGMTPASWARHARLHQSLRELAAGSSVKIVAAEAGYRTPSAFIAAFRATFGTTPARYFAGNE